MIREKAKATGKTASGYLVALLAGDDGTPSLFADIQARIAVMFNVWAEDVIGRGREDDLQAELARVVGEEQAASVRRTKMKRPRTRATDQPDLFSRRQPHPKKTVRLQLLDPLAIKNITLAARYLLRRPRRHQHNVKAGAIENLEDRNSVHRGRLHCHRPHPARLQPLRHLVQITGEPK